MHNDKGQALKGGLASLEAKRKENKVCLRCRKSNYWWGIWNSEIITMSGRKAATLRQKKRNTGSSDDKGTVEPSSSKKAKVSAVVLTSLPLILELDPMDASSTGQAWAWEKMVDTIGRILYEVDSDQFDFELS
jgi:hypothetical protein